jgi:hypothetical protein
MPLDAPVIRKVTSRVLDHTHPNRTKLPSPPICRASFAHMLGTFNLRPVCSAKGNGRDFQSSAPNNEVGQRLALRLRKQHRDGGNRPRPSHNIFSQKIKVPIRFLLPPRSEVDTNRERLALQRRASTLAPDCSKALGIACLRHSTPNAG